MRNSQKIIHLSIAATLGLLVGVVTILPFIGDKTSSPAPLPTQSAFSSDLFGPLGQYEIKQASKHVVWKTQRSALAFDIPRDMFLNTTTRDPGLQSTARTDTEGGRFPNTVCYLFWLNLAPSDVNNLIERAQRGGDTVEEITFGDQPIIAFKATGIHGSSGGIYDIITKEKDQYGNAYRISISPPAAPTIHSCSSVKEGEAEQNLEQLITSLEFL